MEWQKVNYNLLIPQKFNLNSNSTCENCAFERGRIILFVNFRRETLISDRPVAPLKDPSKAVQWKERLVESSQASERRYF